VTPASLCDTSHEIMMPRSMLCALVALAAASCVAANSASDVCSVQIAVVYASPNEDFSFNFDLSRDTTSSSAVLPPGSFTIGIKAYGCNSDSSTIMFDGTSDAQTITGSETSPIQVTVSAVDQSVLDQVTSDESVSFPPIISSLTVSPATASYGEVVTMTATGRKLPTGDPDSYRLVFTQGNSNALSSTTCVSGPNCAITYTPSSPDTGNFEFEFVAADGQEDSSPNPKGYFLVDPNAEVEISFEKTGGPEIKTDSLLFAPTDLDLKASDDSDNTLTVTFNVDDPDLANGDTLDLDIQVSEASTFGQGLETLACDLNLVTKTPGTAVTDNGNSYVPFTISYAATGSAPEGTDWATYGETVCTFAVKAVDSDSTNSQTVTFDVKISGDGLTVDEDGKKPQILSVMYESSVEADTVMNVKARYKDEDDNVLIRVKNAALSITEGTSSKDCASTCLETMAIDFTGVAAGTYTFLVEAVDAAGQVTSQSISIVVTEAGRRRREARVELLDIGFRFENGQLIASIPDRIATELGSPQVLAEEPEAPQNPGTPPTTKAWPPALSRLLPAAPLGLLSSWALWLPSSSANADKPRPPTWLIASPAHGT